MTQTPASGKPGDQSEPTGPGGPDLASAGAAGRNEPGVSAPPDTNQGRSEPLRDSDVPAKGTPGAGDPQAPSVARVAHEGDVAGGLAAREQTQDPGPGDSKGVEVPSQDPAPGSSEDLPSIQTGATADRTASVPVEPGTQTGGTTTQSTVGAHRGSAPDGEVGAG